MDPCGTPTYTGNHSDFWPFSTTLWNMFVKKTFKKTSSNASEIPIDLTFQNKSLMPYFIKSFWTYPIKQEKLKQLL